MTEISSLGSDDFIVYGTAVEQLEGDDATPSKPVPIQEQIATDEKGRRRFHGAFTGGFSAGHFNTVGSIEGWTPRTFQSSRQKRKSMDQRPEDYMDTEDFAAHGIAPKKILTKDAFVGEKQKRKYGVSGPDVALRDLIAPLKESFGAAILRKMGWKLGQGVGPRLTKREKHMRASKYGFKVDGTLDDAKEEDRRAAGKHFAPDDVKPVQMIPKSNFHGIGYKGLDMSMGLLASAGAKRFSLFDEPVSTLSIGAPTAFAKVKKKGITGQAFGVGAFEEDDEDIYSADDMSRYDKTLGEKTNETSRKKGIKAIEAPGAPRILEGFERGITPLHQSKVYPPPDIPKTYNGLRSSYTSSSLVPHSEVPGTYRNRHQHDARSRNAIIEEQAPKTPVVTSVFDLIPTNQKSRIPIFQRAAESEVTILPKVVEKDDQVKKNESPAPKTVSVEEQRRNNLSLFAGSVTLESKMTFRPFEREPAKQQRYELFLKRRSEKNKDAIEEVWMDVGSSMTEWEREREKGEFFRAAALYRPMSGLMAARFTRGQTEEVSNEVEVSVDAGDMTPERKAAVEKKAYGAATRDTFEWHPDRLVCKRFNVPNPYPTSTMVGILKVKRDKFSLFNFLNVPEKASTALDSTSDDPLLSVQPAESAALEPIQAEKPAPKLIMPERSALVLPPVVSRTNVPEVPTERPPMDIFRTIFESSDVEEADDVESYISTPSTAPPQSGADTIKTLLEVDRSTRTLEKKDYRSAQDTPSVIGPAKPPPEVLAAYASNDPYPQKSSDNLDLERRRTKHKKSHKSEKKRKKHKEKKRRKEKSRRGDDSDSSSSKEEITANAVTKMPTRAQQSSNRNGTISSDDDVLDERKLLHKLKNALPGKRLTASDFM